MLTSLLATLWCGWFHRGRWYRVSIDSSRELWWCPACKTEWIEER